MASVLVLNGPNLNLLGIREPGLYGHEDLKAIEERLRDKAAAQGDLIQFIQSNAEHVLVEALHEAFHQKTDLVIINPGALTHTSIALRDAFLATRLPFIEVHLSNVHAREPFRHHSYLSDIARGVIVGFGARGYDMALSAGQAIIQQEQSH